MSWRRMDLLTEPLGRQSGAMSSTAAREPALPVLPAPATGAAPAPMGGGLTVPQGTALSIGAVLGTGVITLPALAAGIAGPASLVAWLALVLLSVPLALTFAAMGARFPDSG